VETVLRIAFVYTLLLLGLRVLGKRELGQLSPFDFVTLMMIPEIVQQAMVREDFSLTNAVIAVCTLFCLIFTNAALSYRFKPVRRVMESRPVVLVHNGRLITRNLDRERVPADEILSEVHKSGIEDLSDVKWAILEPDGRIGIVSFEPGEARGTEERSAIG
jgi:uncharacterized membrane protein YcaP (DUF421 family)